MCVFFFFFFQAEDGIRDPLWSRGLGDVYKGTRGGWRGGAQTIVITYRYTDTLQVYRHPVYTSRHPEYMSRRPNTLPKLSGFSIVSKNGDFSKLGN